jgi:hypothetical protein
MAQLPQEKSEIIWHLKSQLLEIIEQAKASEFALFEAFGETERTMTYLDELQSVAEQATEQFSRFSTLQIRIATAQSPIILDMLELVDRVIQNTQQRIPALKRSIQEIKQEWRLE